MDFKNAKELLALCQKKKLPISEVMRQREILLGESLLKSWTSAWTVFWRS